MEETCKHYTAPRAFPTRKHFLACGSGGVHVDIIPTQTHANAHFFSHMHRSALSAHFQCGNTTLAQGEKEFVSRVRLHSFPSRLACRCQTSRSLAFLKSYPHQLVLLLKLLRLLPRSVAVEVTRALPLAGVRCLTADPKHSL